MSAAGTARQPVSFYWPFLFGAVLSPGIGLGLAAWNAWQLGCAKRVRIAALAGLGALCVAVLNQAWYTTFHRLLREAGVLDMELAHDLFIVALKTMGLAAIAALTVAQSDALRFRLHEGAGFERRVRGMLKIGFYAVFALLFVGAYLQATGSLLLFQTVVRPLVLLY